MEKHVLSKSTFIRGVQCLKSLYLNKKRPFLRDRLPKERLLVFQRGHQVGELAQDLFPGGINMSPGHPAAFRKAIINTQEKISEGFPVIYEAAFQHNGVMIFLDILVHTGSGWFAYEVKSSVGISDTYLMDAALQYQVIQGTGIELQGISLIHIDREYIKDGDIDPKGLFKIVDVTEDAISRQEYVKEQIQKEKETLQLPHSPKIPVGRHCREPYDCDFIGHCWKNEPKAEKLLPIDNFNIASIQELKKPQGTVAFLKLLGMKPAIPKYQGTSPYQDIAYSYCISVNGIKSFAIFMHDDNPEPGLISALQKELSGVDTVICFGQSFLCRKLIPESTGLIDLMDSVNENSKLQKIYDGDSILEKIFEITGTKTDLPEYSSDAVCTHSYLGEYPSENINNSIEEYTLKWTEGIIGLYGFLTAG